MTSNPHTSPITLKDIARKAGVHFSTVSLALRSNPKIAPATRARVLKIAAKMGYERDPVLFALSARRSNSRSPQTVPRIVFLTNRPSIEEFNRVPHMPGFLAGATAQARAMGFACDLVLLADDSRTPEELNTYLLSQGTQGIILGAFLPDLPQVQLDWSRYAVVKIDSWFMRPHVARISHDQNQSVVVACERLAALGYRRIGFAMGTFDRESADNLYSTGFRMAQHQLDLPVIAPLLFTQGETHASCSGRLGQWTRDQKIDVVLSNYTSIKSLLEDAGLSVPRDVACACLCLHEASATLAGTVMSHPTVGSKAVEMIAVLLKTRQVGTHAYAASVYVEGKWADGASAPAKVIPKIRGSRTN